VAKSCKQSALAKTCKREIQGFVSHTEVLRFDLQSLNIIKMNICNETVEKP